MKRGNCCTDYDFITSDFNNNIDYSEVFRESHIRTKKKAIVLAVGFCPWCGKRLPRSLRKTFFEVLEAEYGIVTTIDDYHKNLDVPEEFRSDKWWKRRGL